MTYNREYGRIWKQTPTGELGKCLECSKAYAKKKGDRPERRFCNTLCASRWSAKQGIVERVKKLRARGNGKAYPKLNGRHAHRVIAEEKLGRPLRPGEVVHHKNHNRLDYTPDNLEILPSQGAHCKEHGFGGYNKGNSIYAGTVCAGGCGTPGKPGFAKGRCRRCYLRQYNNR